MTIQRHDITGVVLAGGQGQRMSGADKGWVLFREEPLIVHALRRLKPQVGGLIINANRELPRYRALGHRVVSDESDNDTIPYAGPLAGVLAALRVCTTPWIVTVPCDSPKLPDNLVARLVGAVMQADSQPTLATAITPNAKGHQTHPVFSLLHSSLKTSLVAYLEGGGRSMHQWLKQAGALQVSFDDSTGFANLNTMQELEELQSRAINTGL
ncbi:MAG: molybdenum cofactor guanylyltransferase [Rhizobacter sp.]